MGWSRCRADLDVVPHEPVCGFGCVKHPVRVSLLLAVFGKGKTRQAKGLNRDSKSKAEQKANHPAPDYLPGAGWPLATKPNLTKCRRSRFQQRDNKPFKAGTVPISPRDLTRAEVFTLVTVDRVPVSKQKPAELNKVKLDGPWLVWFGKSYLRRLTIINASEPRPRRVNVVGSCNIPATSSLQLRRSEALTQHN